MNCGIHRHAIVEILIANDVLPDNIYQEIKFDSDHETRQLYKRVMNMNQEEILVNRKE
jgi:hypothetical protein